MSIALYLSIFAFYSQKPYKNNEVNRLQLILNASMFFVLILCMLYDGGSFQSYGEYIIGIIVIGVLFISATVIGRILAKWLLDLRVLTMLAFSRRSRRIAVEPSKEEDPQRSMQRMNSNISRNHSDNAIEAARPSRNLSGGSIELTRIPNRNMSNASLEMNRQSFRRYSSSSLLELKNPPVNM